jgi:hypothetical protein
MAAHALDTSIVCAPGGFSLRIASPCRHVRRAKVQVRKHGRLPRRVQQPGGAGGGGGAEPACWRGVWQSAVGGAPDCLLPVLQPQNAVETYFYTTVASIASTTTYYYIGMEKIGDLW